jgi:hypothetical protein
MRMRQQRYADACPASTGCRIRPMIRARYFLLPTLYLDCALSSVRQAELRAAGAIFGLSFFGFFASRFCFAIAALLALCHVRSHRIATRARSTGNGIIPRTRRGSTERANDCAAIKDLLARVDPPAPSPAPVTPKSRAR